MIPAGVVAGLALIGPVGSVFTLALLREHLHPFWLVLSSVLVAAQVVCALAYAGWLP